MYHRYLKPGGRLISVIDDGFLTGPSHAWFRDALRKLYIIRAVVSLPGDAFQRSEARVKTSFVVLKKRSESEPYTPDSHPAIFMYPCRFVGIDDPKRNRWMPGDDQARADALNEVATVVEEYQRFLRGESTEYAVPARRARDRLDVKYCWVEPNRRPPTASLTLADVAAPKTFPADDIIECANHEEHEQALMVRYDGTAEAAPAFFPKTDTQYPQLWKVAAGDLVVSNIAATYGSVAVVPDDLAGTVVSSEYTVLYVKPPYDARVVWALLRTPEVRAELLIRTTGANRTRVRWTNIKDIPFPYPSDDAAKRFVQRIEAAEQARAQARSEHDTAIAALNAELSLDTEQAHRILGAFKPPA